MSDTETPRDSFPAKADWKIILYRLDLMEKFRKEDNDNRAQFERDMRSFIEYQRDQESDHKIAIANCATHGLAITEERRDRISQLSAADKRMDAIERSIPSKDTIRIMVQSVLPDPLKKVNHKGAIEKSGFWIGLTALLGAIANALQAHFK